MQDFRAEKRRQIEGRNVVLACSLPPVEDSCRTENVKSSIQHYISNTLHAFAYCLMDSNEIICILVYVH